MGTAHGGDHRRQRQGDFQAGERRGAEELERRSRRRSPSRNISTATSPTGPIRTRAAAKLPCGSSCIASRGRSPIGASRTAISRTRKSAETFYDELTWLCVNQYGAFNSPVWFNVGLYHQYGVGRGAGHGNYFYNRETGRAERAATQYEYPQGSACFIQSVEDTMEDIMRLAMSEAMLFKYGSGTGSDLSSLREHAGKTERRRQAERAAFVPEGLRSGRERGEERRQDAARGEDEHAQGLAPGHRGIHRREAEGREEGVGADRAGLRRQLQRRRLRLGHVSE